jgi:hypothetical protein
MSPIGEANAESQVRFLSDGEALHAPERSDTAHQDRGSWTRRLAAHKHLFAITGNRQVNSLPFNFDRKAEFH